MKIVTTFHQSSSVLSSLKCQLGTRDTEHLVVAKLNRLDVYSLKPQGLHHECGVEIWGKVLTVKAIPQIGSARSTIVLMIAHPDPELVFFTYIDRQGDNPALEVSKKLSLFERIARPAEFFNDILVHPSGKLALVSCYSGKLKIIRLKSGTYDKDYDVQLPEVNVFSVTFLSSFNGEYAVAILYLDYQERVQLVARDILVDGDDITISEEPSTLLHPTPISNKTLPFPTESVPQLVSVPPEELDEDTDVDDAFLGGVLVVGGRQILLFELSSEKSQEKQRGKRKRLESRKSSKDVTEIAKAREKEKEREGRLRKPKSRIEWPFSELAAWCAIDKVPYRYLIGDSFGRLSMISLDKVQKIGLVLIPLGEASSPTSLTYLTNQFVYVGSHSGDSQLIRLSPLPISSSDSPTLSIPPEIKTVSPNMLEALGHRKGKSKSVAEDHMDEDHDDEDDASQGYIVETHGSFFEVLSSYKNLAPILDAISVDTDGSGQQHIVTCSGARSTGSINIVRNGADFQEIGHVPGLIGVVGVWSVRTMLEDTTDRYILVSTNRSTHLFEIDDSGSTTTITPVDSATIRSLVTTEATLAFSNLARRSSVGGSSVYKDSPLVVQVVASGARLLRSNTAFGGYELVAEYSMLSNVAYGQRPLEVVAASANASQLVMAASGGKLILWRLGENVDALEIITACQRKEGPEISAVSCAPLNTTKRTSPTIIVSYWQSNTIEILQVLPKGLESVYKSPTLPALVRSVLLYNFGSDTNPKGTDHHPYLLAGLANGTVASFRWKDKQLTDKKIIPLGHAPVNLMPCQVEGRHAVFAAGNRATVLSFENKRLVHSPIMLKDISSAARLNTPTFASSLILATPTGLFIGRVQGLGKLHIRSIPFGFDNPRKIAHEPSLKAFGVAFTTVEPNRVNDPEISRSSFRLLDDSSFANLCQFNCDPDEETTAVVSFSQKIAGKPMPFFCVGTYVYKTGEVEPSTGRLMLFTASTSTSSNLALSLMASTKVPGCVYALTVVQNQIVAAVNSSVMLFRLESSSDSLSPSLIKVSEWHHNYLVTSLGSYADRVVVGDQPSSISLLQVTQSKLISHARDYGPLWPVCVEALDERHVIGANDSLNLFTFSLEKAMGRSRLERDGCYHVADLVTKILRGSLSSSDASTTSPLKSEAMFFTSSGRIGVVVDVKDEELSLQLTNMQRNLANVIQGVGGSSHSKYRAPKTTRGTSDADSGAVGFLDGDFLEQFLTHVLSPQQSEKVIQGRSPPERLTITREALQMVIEDLQSLH